MRRIALRRRPSVRQELRWLEEYVSQIDTDLEKLGENHGLTREMFLNHVAADVKRRAKKGGKR